VHCKARRYFFYKNMTYTLTQFWFNLYALNSGQRLYDDWYQAFYNLLFTSLPVIVAGLLDQDVSKVRPAMACRRNVTPDVVQGLAVSCERDAILSAWVCVTCSAFAYWLWRLYMGCCLDTTCTGVATPGSDDDYQHAFGAQEGAFSTPQLYIPGQRNQPFSWRVLGTWLASAVWNSAVCFYVPVWALAPAAVSSTGLMIDIWATGTLGYTLIIVTVRAAHAVLPSQGSY